jgi:hypothetical protein
MSECTNSCFQCCVINYFSWVAVPLVVESLVIFLFGVLRVTAGRRGVVNLWPERWNISHDLAQSIYRIAMVFALYYYYIDDIRQHKFVLAV